MVNLAKLQWQCRRGTQELDLLLQRYLETQFMQADKEEQACFVDLLALEDDVLISLLFNADVVTSKTKQELLGKIRS
ncbi:MAG: succinate dehydrogenase assembly factor 2 [Methylococcales bacterium]|nr:MAG: succinate dehydrogenase assembly factor 2 [Methylococcales bacterium]